MKAGIAERIGVCCSHPLLLSLLSLHRIRSAFSPPHPPYPEMHGGGSRFVSVEPCLLWFFCAATASHSSHIKGKGGIK